MGEDRFEELRALEDESSGKGSDSTDDSDESEAQSEPEPEPEPEPAADPERSQASSETDRRDESTTATPTHSKSQTETPESTDQTADTDAESEPAFGYNEADQGPIYAPTEVWDLYDDALELDIERELRDRGVRNASKRELHAATLRLAARNPTEVAEILLETRRE